MGEWSHTVDEKLQKKLRASARTCQSNGDSLLDEADLLAAAGKFNRATALTVLAEEEFAKALVLRDAAFQRRWDSNQFKALTQHEKKQKIAAVMRVYAEEQWSFMRGIQDQLVPPPMPSPGAVDHAALQRAIEGAQRTQRSRERQKHHALYTGINGDGSVDSEPNLAEQDFDDVRDEAGRMRQVLEQAFHGDDYLERPDLRT